MVGHEEVSTVSNDSEDDDMESFYTWEPILKLVSLHPAVSKQMCSPRKPGQVNLT